MKRDLFELFCQGLIVVAALALVLVFYIVVEVLFNYEMQFYHGLFAGAVWIYVDRYLLRRWTRHGIAGSRT